MTTFGYFLASEEHGPRDLVHQARMAEASGFEALWISDHYHPWLDAQGEASFVWSVIGAIAQATSLPVTTAVTCPLQRLHPAIVAQAAATCGILTDGRFRLGLGTGEALNEHITGAAWPNADERLKMLEEAVHVIRRFFSGELVTHRGDHYTVETARLYSRPEQQVPLYISAFGDKAATLAGRIGDGFICAKPDPHLREVFESVRGAGRPSAGGLKVCWDPDEAEARKTVMRLWPTEALQGEALQLLPMPRHFEQLADLVTEDMLPIPCGPDPQVHADAIQAFVDAGYQEVYVNQIGPRQQEFFAFFQNEILPRLH